ncbi:MAG: dephospho-CoA kinase [Acidobacteria bacterium]|nr:dephospho-CoA kinase [Acidobacteriota bacterium]
MLKVALTGGIGTGKSAVLAAFAELGIPVIDADAVAHQAMAAGTPAAAAIRQRFGIAVMSPDGDVDRTKLGPLVFADDRARQDLEAIVHPAVYDAIDGWMAGARRAGARVAIAEVPLLFETRHEGDFDRVVVTACDEEAQVQRVQRRSGLSEDEVRRRIAAQWPLADKVRRAHDVIWTDGTMDDTRARARAVGESLLRDSVRY